MTFSQFSQYLQKLEGTSSRLEMTAQLAELFNQLEPDETPAACYLMQGQLVPSYQSLEFAMSDKLTMRALAKVLKQLQPNNSLPNTNLFAQEDDSLYLQQIKQAYKKHGDLGEAIEGLLLTEKRTELPVSSDHSSSLSILKVHRQLVAIAQDEGTGSQERKIGSSSQLLARLDPTSIKFVVRIIIGKLRLGFSTMTMIDALSWAKHGDKSASSQIEKAYEKKADIGQLAKGFLQTTTPQQQEQFLNSYEVEVGVPVLPALCQRLNTAQEIIEKLGEVIVEPKFDGLRAQIHLDSSRSGQPFQVFTRSLENVTHMFPELQLAVAQVSAQSCILDAEAIGYDPQTEELLPFQQTITRKRKHDISKESEKTPIRFYVFDIMYLDGSSLLNQPLEQRKNTLALVVSSNHTLQLAEYLVTSDPKELHDYHYRQLEKGLEGAVIKRIDSKYRAGRKGWRWVKIKEREGERGKLNDSLDCVVLGYYLGKGKRAKFGVGAFLAGILAEDGQVKTIAKIGTGLSDEQFRQLKKTANQHQVEQSPANYDVPKELKPDVWLQPKLVVEIAADELTNSPLHSAGKALRFPRLVRFRDDKTWEQATTLKELESIEVA